MAKKSPKRSSSAASKRATGAGFKVEMWPIDKLIPYGRNPRKIPQKAIDKVAASIREFGWRQPIVCDQKGVIIIGRTRLAAAQQLKQSDVPVHVATGLSAKQIKALRIADNRVAQETDWDDELLRLELTDLHDLDFDLDLTGFDDAEIAKLLAPIGDDEPGSTDPQLGGLEYRVVVDCADEQAQAALMERLQEEGYTCRALMS